MESALSGNQAESALKRRPSRASRTYQKGQEEMQYVIRVAKRWKQPKCPSTGEEPSKLWSTRTMEYYSDTKRNEGPPPVTTGMSLENVMLRERSWS